ncbi:uncharacterized protein LOC134709407 [Mytilus trossulus]|uniref:uncharacterized protein LOC134709407 n=1 Tax=Mytilus trossulus TaxID=6551 RepID=UPI0030062CE5
MMYHAFLVISIVAKVLGQEKSKDTAFFDRDVNALIEQLHTLSFENREIVNFNSKLLMENENLKHSIQNLERRVHSIERNIPLPINQQHKQGFESSIHANLYKNVTKTNSQGYPLPSKIHHPMLMSKKMNENNHTKDKRQVKRGTSGEVAFSGVVKDTLQNIGDHQDIPFKTVDVDTHNAFHGDSGIFTVPVAGYYAVFATIMTHPGTRLDFLIVKNGQTIGYGYSKGHGYSDDEVYGTGSTSAIINLAIGDKIWVKTNGNYHFGSGDMVVELYSSFMGYRL